MPAKIIMICFAGRQRLKLRLFQDFGQPLAAVELVLRDLVEVAAELRESRQFTILRQVELERPADLPHRLDLRAAADAADRQADVDRRTHA